MAEAERARRFHDRYEAGRRLAEELGENVQPQQATFMEKLKSLFG